MVKMGAARVSEPAAGAACPPLPGGGSSTPALLQSMWRWHHPHEGDDPRLALQTSEEDAERLAAVLSEHESEVARVESVVRSAKRDDGEGVVGTMRLIVQERGPGGLFAGLLPRCFQAAYQTVFMVCVPRLLDGAP